MTRILNIIRSFALFVTALWQNKFLIGQLTKREFQNKYLGSYLGLPWAFLKPLAIVMVMWFAFTYGLKIGRVDENVPFSLWLVIGIVPWFYLSDNILGTAFCLSEYSFLIKNIQFRPSIIPLIKIFSNSIIHVFFIFIMIIFAVSNGFIPALIWVQVLYYLVCSLALTLGLAWLFSSVQLFIKDVGHILEVILQIIFWGTPIIWSHTMLPAKMLIFIKLNPVYYIIQGYRDTFIYGTWFFEHAYLSIYFWGITFFIFALGALVFKRLKPHFADVL